jgi:glycosyltransferase involved in cell wall biosynthesis
MAKHLRILGTRGIPASHGGFETFAENLALYLTGNGWDVTVYCQSEQGTGIQERWWRGVRLVKIPVQQKGVAGTIIFDMKSTLHASKEPGLLLTLGYNTAIFCLLYRLKGMHNLINMDGIEWRRKKWNLGAKIWLYCNEWAGAWLGNLLIADHPQIKEHLATRVKRSKIMTIAYGAPRIESADAGILQQYGLSPNGYAIMIARPEPENSVLEIVQAWSRNRQGMKLVVLGTYSSDVPLQKAVLDAASDEVMFVGAIYEKAVIAALRFYARVYIHGHQVGGTNPSLVEALGAGNAVIAHDNRFNRWVAGEQARYFECADSLAAVLDQVLHDEIAIAQMSRSSVARHREEFTWSKVLQSYEGLFFSLLETAEEEPLPLHKIK